MLQLNLLVLKTDRLKALKNQYEALGLHFEYHQHGKGPFHYSAMINDLVVEIYPLSSSEAHKFEQMRLGFAVSDLASLIEQISTTNWEIITKPKYTSWGYRAVVQDIDGRKVELIEK